jgi:hypothetical protein
MKYKNGIEVQQGDIAMVNFCGERLSVIHVLKPESEEANFCGYLNGGIRVVSVEGDELFYTDDGGIDEDIVFIRRASETVCEDS